MYGAKANFQLSVNHLHKYFSCIKAFLGLLEVQDNLEVWVNQATLDPRVPLVPRDQQAKQDQWVSCKETYQSCLDRNVSDSQQLILWRSLLGLAFNLLNLYPASYEDSLKFFRRADQTTIEPNITYRSQKIKQTYAVRPRAGDC